MKYVALIAFLLVTAAAGFFGDSASAQDQPVHYWYPSNNEINQQLIPPIDPGRNDENGDGWVCYMQSDGTQRCDCPGDSVPSMVIIFPHRTVPAAEGGNNTIDDSDDAGESGDAHHEAIRRIETVQCPGAIGTDMYYPCRESERRKNLPAGLCWRLGEDHPMYQAGHRWHMEFLGADERDSNAPTDRSQQANICPAWQP